jgi:hypothetical protein
MQHLILKKQEPSGVITGYWLGFDNGESLENKGFYFKKGVVFL